MGIISKLETDQRALNILVTGCSSGIGLAIAKRLIKTPHRICITARESSLERLMDAGFHNSDRLMIRPLDVTNDAQRFDLIEEMGWQWGGVDVLINNAGVSYRAVVEHMTDEEEIHQMETNFLGPMGLIRLVLPHMRKQKFGKIINVSSVGGMMAMPTMSSYSASKFALEGASESLWYEVRPWNISVTLVQPGFVRSDSFKNVYYSRKSGGYQSRNDDYFRYYAAMSPFVEKLMNLSRTTADDVACQVMKIVEMSDPPLRWAATLDAQVFNFLRRMLPRRFYHWFLYRSLPRGMRFKR